jgi:hypothetical protein
LIIKWYDKGQLLSYKAFFNMLIGNRGGGKTYCFKTWAIDDFLKTGKQFVWLRRYGTEIDEMRKTYFDDIAKRYPEYNFSIKGSRKSGKILIDNKVAGYYFALTTSSIAKSSSYTNVDKIIFDEFLIIGNTYKYLSDEVVLLLELVETIFRDRENDPTAIKPRGVYLLGNNVTIANPYFLYFNIKPFKQRFYVDKERGIVVEQYTNKAFVEAKKQSSIGKLTAGTTYAEYSIENKSYLDNDRFIAPKPSKCTFNCAIDYKGKTYGFWLDYKNGNMYVNYQYDPDSPNRYSLTKDDHTINTFLVKNLNNTYIKNIVWLFRAGCMYFENQQIKSQVYELLSYFVR